MESILIAILANDNAARAAAEIHFAEIKSAHPLDVLFQLSAVLNSSPNESYRSLSAILLRGIVLREPQIWGTLTPVEFEHVRNQLLDSLIKEEVGHLQRKIAETVATHAKLSPWPALMQGVMQLSSSENAKHNELCLFLLDRLAENVGALLVSNLDTVMSIILPFLTENNKLQTRSYAAQALSSLLFEIPDGNVLLCSSLQNIPYIITAAVAAQEDLQLQDILSNIGRLAKERSELFSQSWELFFGAIQSLCENEDIEGGTKVMGLEITIALITSRKSPFCSTEKSRKDCLMLCMRLMTVVDDEDESVSSHVRPESEESGFGNVAGDGGDGTYQNIFFLYFTHCSPSNHILLLNCLTLTASSHNLPSQSFSSIPELCSSLFPPCFFTESGFGDVAGDGGDGNISDFAAVCLDSLSQAIDPLETVRVCMTTAWGLVSQDDWRSRRAALLIVSIICEGTRDCLYTHLKTLVPTVVTRVTDPHPRVRFIAIHCLEVFISEFTGGESDEEDSENNGNKGQNNGKSEKSFQALFKDVPSVLCASISNNYNFPRIVYASLSALKSYFNPDVCSVKICTPFGGNILDFSIEMMKKHDVLLFVKEECASLIGNISILYAKKISIERYNDIMRVLKVVIFETPLFNTHNALQNTQRGHELSLLKAKCLESVTLVGKAMGRKVFSPTAHEYLEIFKTVHMQGMDFSDPISSYIMQACVRIAGVIGDDFQPYVSCFIPPLLQRISQEINVRIREETNCFQTDSSSSSSSSSNGNNGLSNGNNYNNNSSSSSNTDDQTFTVYKRGIGNINISCNTNDIQEKETACRCLYQYLTDIPHLLWEHSLVIVQSTGILLTSLLNRSDDLFLIVGGILTVTHKMFLKYSSVRYLQLKLNSIGNNSNNNSNSNNSNNNNNNNNNNNILPEELQCIETMDEMTRLTLQYLKISFNQLYYITQTNSNNDSYSSTLIIVGTINDILKTRYDNTQSLYPSSCWLISLTPDLITEYVTMLTEMSVLYVQKRFLDPSYSDSVREEDVQVEDDLWNALIEATGWIIKISGDMARESVVSHLMPFIQGILKSESNPPSLMLHPIRVLLDIIEFIPTCSEECSAVLMPLLFNYMNYTELTVSCVFGLGVCAMHGGLGFDPHCSKAVGILLSAAGADPNQILPLQGEDVDPAVISDNAYSSLFKISIFRHEALQSTAAGLLQFCFQNLPLNSDVVEANAVHTLFVDLLVRKDLRLLGATGRLENLTQVLFILAQLAAVDDGNRIDNILKNSNNITNPKNADTDEGNGDDDDFWDEVIITARTLHQARTVIKNAFSDTGIPKQILMPAMESLGQEISSILLYFASL